MRRILGKIAKFLNERVLGPYFQEPVPFECDRSGRCCRNLEISKERLFEVRKNNRGPFYRTLPKKGLKGVMIFDWERKGLEEELAKIGKKGDFEPGIVIIPKNEKERPIIAKWLFYYSECPFVRKSGLCGIYEKRPLTCRRFPLAGESVFSQIRKGGPAQIAISNICCDGERTNLPAGYASIAEMAERFSKAFGGCFEAKLKADADDLVILGLYRFLWKRMDFDFREEYMLPERAWEIGKKGVPISEFFEKRGILDRKRLLKAVERNRKALREMFFRGQIQGIKSHKVRFD